MVGRQGSRARTPLPRRPVPPDALRVTDGVLLDVLGPLAAADTDAEVADVVLTALGGLPGVRAALLGRSRRRGLDLVVVGSTGYDCSTMAVGALLPLSAGLPVTEAARTGTPQVVGPGPSWVAVPAGPGAALLLSLGVPPPDDDGLARLVRLGGALDGALQRVDRGARARTELAVLEEGLAAAAVPAPGLVVRSEPYRPPLSGDVVAVLDDGPVRWVLLADVCGRGARAAVDASRLRAAFLACAAGAPDPTSVLARLDAVPASAEEGFATALVLRIEGTQVRVASAGHPAPLRASGTRVDVDPGEPLGLRLARRWPGAVESVLQLAPGDRLLLATDGLVDRGREVDLEAVVRALPDDLGADDLADVVLAACAAAGPAEDDATLVVLTL